MDGVTSTAVVVVLVVQVGVCVQQAQQMYLVCNRYGDSVLGRLDQNLVGKKLSELSK